MSICIYLFTYLKNFSSDIQKNLESLYRLSMISKNKTIILFLCFFRKSLCFFGLVDQIYITYTFFLTQIYSTYAYHDYNNPHTHTHIHIHTPMATAVEIYRSCDIVLSIEEEEEKNAKIDRVTDLVCI